MKTTANVLAVKNNRVLLVRSKNKTNWTLPGGKHEKDESDKACARRECKEELPHAKIKFISKLGVFEGISPNTKVHMTSTTFLATVTGDITPGAEIQQSKWFSKKELKSIIVSDLTLKILQEAKFYS
jgi:ADP-ribose pyrophosphatase YjhB (NUDIX family)